MSYVNLPDNLRDLIYNIKDRIYKLEVGPKNIYEPISVTGTAATGTLNIDVATTGIWYYNSNATANFTINFRGNADISFDNYVPTNSSLTTVILNQNGTTAYYPSVYKIDGTTITPKWYPSAPSAGNASATDAYTITIIKTASATYTALATVVSFK